MKTIGDTLRIARKRANLRQIDAANAVHISNKALSVYESNRARPPLDVLKKLCELYQISADEVLDIQILKEDEDGKDSVILNEEQKRLLSYFDKCNIESKEALLGMAIVYSRDKRWR